MFSPLKIVHLLYGLPGVIVYLLLCIGAIQLLRSSNATFAGLFLMTAAVVSLLGFHHSVSVIMSYRTSSRTLTRG